MNDKFMSGWGPAKGKINKLVFECENMKEAITVEDNAISRNDMNYINIRMSKPYYDSIKFYVQFKDKNVYPNWYRQNSF
jgi:hypothetical protein